MAYTYEPIATTTTTTASPAITFSSISQNYTDLALIISVRANSTPASYGTHIRFNSDTGSNYSETYLRGNGSTASSSRFTNNIYMNVGWQGYATTTIPQFCTVDIFSYAGSTFKTALGEDNADRNGAGVVVRFVGLWRSTSAINSIVVNENAGGGNYAAGSTFTLYGILKA